MTTPVGAATYLANSQITSVDALYDEAVQGRDMVLRLIPKQGQTKSVLLQFFDSRDVHELAWSSTNPTTTLVAAASTYPALTTNFTFGWSRNHKSRGYVYVLGDENGPNRTFVLADGDRNGTIDQAFGVPDVDWLAGNWGEESDYFP